MARALGVQSRANWQVITVSLSGEPELCKTTENPHFSFFAPLSHTVTTLAPKFSPSSQLRTLPSVGGPLPCVCGRLLTRVCAACVLRVRVCGPLHLCAGTPHFSVFSIIFALTDAGVVVSCLHHTVPPPLKLSHLWQPLHNSSHTSSSPFCDGHGRCTFVRVCVPCFLGT